MNITLHKRAPWTTEDNQLLREVNAARNGGETVRYAYVAGRRFRATREGWDDGWFVTEVFADGRDIWIDRQGNETPESRSGGRTHELRWCAYGGRLSDIRKAIEGAT